LAHESYQWTLDHVTSASRSWLGALPFRIDLRPLGGHTAGPRLTLLHGNPVLKTVYWTEDRSDAFCLQMAESIDGKPGHVIAFGHTHKPWHRRVGDIHFVNTGSVGRPKDGDPRAGYALVDLGAGDPVVEFVRVNYDVERAAGAILKSTLPDAFADYLRTGGMPAVTRTEE
jgi:diadenosine tetraphosphatase ApaH/serine/threonine PP2A family protein phosphatase